MSKIEIVIADGNFLSRKGLAALLNENKDFLIKSEATSAIDLIERAKVEKPNLIIIDYTSTNFSVEDLALMVKKYPKSKYLAITDVQSNEVLAKVLRIGITSHLLKDCDQDEIVEAIYKTANGEKFMCSKIASAALDENFGQVDAYSCEGLNVSDREIEIITLIAEGLSNKEVADKLFLSAHTVTTHRKNIMNKLGVNNTAGLVLFAVKENLVSPNHFLFAESKN